MDSFFTELGRTVRQRWQEANFTLERFPEIARAALEERPPAQHVEVAELIRSFLLDDAQPFQTQSGFGQPELVFYDDPRFYIQVLFWLEGTTDIHQHMFSGAFHVLEGSSIHSRFVFEDRVPVTPHLELGCLKITETRLLETGATVPIISGAGYIHSLFHLDTPSLTVVVRTHSDPAAGVQFTYLPPHLAVDPFHQDALTMRRKQLLDVLEKVDDPGYAELVLEMIGQLDFERGFFILQNGLGHLGRTGEWEEALEAFREKHGTLAEGIGPTVQEIVRRDGLAALRGSIRAVEHRFFLALLMNVPEREALLALVAQRIPGPPGPTILRWAAELIEVSEAGTWLVDAEFPVDLDVPEDEQPAVMVQAVAAALDRREPGDEVQARLRDALRDSSWRVFLTSSDAPGGLPPP